MEHLAILLPALGVMSVTIVAAAKARPVRARASRRRSLILLR